MNLKRIIMSSSLAKQAKEVQAWISALQFSNESEKIVGHRTVYSISPYKTGTTFLAGAYDQKISRHEPIHHLSLKGLERDFDTFFIRRLNTLNLKLECSGYWSAYIEQLSRHSIAKDLQYICLLRKPSAWINSTVNYWHRPWDKIQYDYVTELFWKPKVGITPRKFMYADAQEQEGMIEKLSTYYFKYLRQTQILSNVHYVNLEEIEPFFTVLDEIIQEKADPKKSWRRENKAKEYNYSNEDLDQEYEQLIRTFVKTDSARIDD